MRTKAVKERLRDPGSLPDIETARQSLRVDADQAELARLEAEADLLKAKLKPAPQARKQLIQKHRSDRKALLNAQKTRAGTEAKARATRFARGLGAVWQFVTGKRAKLKRENRDDLERCKARDRKEREALAAKQRQERRKQEMLIKERLQRLKQAQAQIRERPAPDWFPNLQ